MNKIKLGKNYLIYNVEDGEIIIEEIKVYEQRKGIGTQLINKLKEIARNKYDNRDITLYAYPQDNTITDDGLRQFYLKNDFNYDADDTDYRLMRY